MFYRVLTLLCALSTLSSPNLALANISTHGDFERYIKAIDGRSTYVDLRDLLRHSPSQIRELDGLFSELMSRSEAFFGRGIKLGKTGVKKAPESRINRVYSLEFYRDPERYDDPKRTVDFFVSAHVQSQVDGHLLQKIVLRSELGPSGRRIISKSLTVLTASLSQVIFSAQVDLRERKLVLSNQRYQFKKVIPLDVGGLDEGVIQPGQHSFLTPAFSNASLSRAMAIEARDDKEYYREMPFLRISDSSGGYTPFGFHITMAGGLQRGFESHGCIRMREADLYSLYALVTEHGSPQLSLNIKVTNEELNGLRHPFPKKKRTYQRVLNLERDDDGLIKLERVRGNPPLLQFLQN